MLDFGMPYSYDQKENDIIVISGNSQKKIIKAKE